MNSYERPDVLANPLSTGTHRHPHPIDTKDGEAVEIQTAANASKRTHHHPVTPRPRPSGKEPAVSTLLDRLPAPLLAIVLAEGDQLVLPLVWEIAPGVEAVPPTPRHLRLVGSIAAQATRPNDFGPAVHTGGSAVPPPMWVARMARAIAEVASGDRPPQQLTKWVEKRQLAMLAARGKAAQRHPSAIHGRDARAATRSLQQVRAIRVCPVAPGVAETSAVLVGEGRGRAVAMRFEALHEIWQVTAIAIG